MAKVITLSRTFPAGHPKAGQPTYFVEKVWRSLTDGGMSIFGELMECQKQYDHREGANHEIVSIMGFTPKHHTMRAGKRWKDGEMASLRVWSGKPYNSGQIEIAPDVKLKVKDVEISKEGYLRIDGESISHITLCHHIVTNDGLTMNEFTAWFKKLPFSGQLLIWNADSLTY